MDWMRSHVSSRRDPAWMRRHLGISADWHNAAYITRRTATTGSRPGMKPGRSRLTYSASESGISWTGPLSWPLAEISRSTNSITAISAASP
jgi:hypothetical protein